MSMMQEEIGRRLPTIKELFASDREFSEKRDRAIKKCFDGNQNAFEQFISAIEPIQDWKTALDVIEDEFKKKKIKPDSKEATGLTDVLFKRYFPSY